MLFDEQCGKVAKVLTLVQKGPWFNFSGRAKDLIYIAACSIIAFHF